MCIRDRCRIDHGRPAGDLVAERSDHRQHVDVGAQAGDRGRRAPAGSHDVDAQLARARSASGDVVRSDGERRPPDLPPFDECVRMRPPVPDSGFGERVHIRLHPDDATFRDGRPTGTGQVSGWFTFADAHPADQQIDAFGLLQASDAFAPVCFNRFDVPVAWAPTLELTVHVRGVPAAGPLRCRFRNRFMQNGLFDEDGEIWDSRGAIVAQSRQLALIPRG